MLKADKLEVVASFCYLGDMLSAGEGCEITVTIRVKTAWTGFPAASLKKLGKKLGKIFYKILGKN